MVPVLRSAAVSNLTESVGGAELCCVSSECSNYGLGSEVVHFRGGDRIHAGSYRIGNLAVLESRDK